jgi:CRP-like cAMP-binding protein
MPPSRASLKAVRSRKPGVLFDPKTLLATAGIGRTVRRYNSKQVIFSQGERADTVLYIQQGRVRLSVLSKQGKEATIALLGPGDFLGEGCIAADQPLRSATATAIDDCCVLQIQRRELLRTLHLEHEFSDLFCCLRHRPP